MDNDFTTDEDKQRSRAYNLREVKRAPALFDKVTGKLRVDWAEWAGRGAPTLHYLRKEGVLGPAQFIGIDHDEETYRELIETHGQAGVDHRFCRMPATTALLSSTMRRVGVYNMDTTYTSGSSGFREHLHQAWLFALAQLDRIGSFALILNVGMDRGFTVDDFRGALEAYGHYVSDEELSEEGVLYGKDREGRNSRRLNYCLLLGPHIERRTP